MTSHWKELLATDRYIVRTNGLLHDLDQKVLTMLYQPLIGAISYSLYMTLWTLTDKDTLWGKELSHRNLMNLTGSDLKQIFVQRSKLEAIGLLNVYVKKEEANRLFIYELQTPLSPEKFLNDGTLEVFLYNRLGKKKFDDVKMQFVAEAIPKEGFENITKSFNEVFESLHVSELMPSQQDSEMIESLSLKPEQEFVDRKNAQGIAMTEKLVQFDFQQFVDDLSSVFVPKEVITPAVKEAILNLAYIYKINNPLEMSKIIQNAFLHDQKIDIGELRKEIQRWYKFEHENKLPFLSLRHQPKQYQQVKDKKVLTDEEKTIKEYETMSPYELLKERSGGGKPALSDLKVVESVMFEQGLLPGVVNVLVDYVLYINQLKLPKGYVEKIAAYWVRKKVKTVSEAMKLAREENRKYKEWLNQKSAPATKERRKQPVRQDVLPKWMSEQEGQNNQQKKQATETDNEKKNALKERLRKMK